MPEYTPNYSIAYPAPRDWIKDQNVAAKLAEDLKQTALTVDAAVTRTQWKKARIPNGVDIREFMTGAEKEGQYTSWTAGNTATMSGLPQDLVETPRGFTAVAATLNAGVTITLTTYDVSTVNEYVCSSAPSTGAGWTAWRKVVYEDSDVFDTFTSSRASGTKVIPLALTLGRSGGVTSPTSGVVVIPTGWNAPILRWRLAVRDGNPRFGTAQSNPTSFTNIQANGQTVINTASMPAGTDVWYTNWVDGDPNESIGFQYAATVAPTAQVGGGTLNGSPVSGLPFEMWVEAETPTTTAVVAVGGDSNACGVGTEVPIHDSWISQYCRRVGALPVHYAASGDAYSGWRDPGHHKWTRWDHLDRPDVMIMAWGSNDAGREGPASEIIADAQVVWDIAARKVTGNHHAITIKPRNSGTSGYNAARRGYNNWIKTQPDPLRAWHDMVTPVSSDDVIMDPGMYAPDGTHMSTAGHKALADSITAPVAVSGRTQVAEVSAGIYEIGA